MIWIVYVISSLAGLSLLGPPPIWSGVDSRVNNGHYRPSPVEYRTWTSSPRIDPKGNCTFTVFPLVTREKLTRLRINGQEQLLDWSWSWEAEVPAGNHGSGMRVEYVEAVGGQVVADHEITASCPWRGDK